MYSATFMVEVGSYDDEFHRLNDRVIEIAEASPGYLGRESWTEGDRNVVILYWRTLEELKEFGQHPEHLEAKSRYREWYAGYKVVIAEVLREYGDGRYPAPFIGSRTEASDG